MKRNLIVLMILLLSFLVTATGYAQNPRRAEKNFQEGLKSFRVKDFKGAIGNFNLAISNNSRFVKAYVFRGLSYFMLGEHKKAIEDLNIAIQGDPQNVTALFARGQAYFFIGESRKAIADFSGVINKQPENAMSYMQRAISYYRIEDMKKAVSDSSKAISYNPKNPDAYFLRGACYLRQGLYDAVVRDFKMAVDLKPDNPFYQLTYYVAKARNGDNSTDELKAFRDGKESKSDEFPYYLIDMMLETKTPAETLKLAEQYKPARLKGLVLQQTQYFVSQYFYIHGDEIKGKKYNDLAMNGKEKLFMIQGLVKNQFYEFLGPAKKVCGELCQP